MADFSVVLTNIGRQRIVEAIASGTFVNVTKVALGDGKTSEVLGSDGLSYRALRPHTSALDSQPITGANWNLFWEQAGSATVAWAEGMSYYKNPYPTMTQLIHQVFIDDVSSVEIDPLNPTWVRVDLIVPYNEGGFWVREIGIYNEDDELIAVGSSPDIYKPILPEGANIDLHLRVIMEVENASVVTLQVDPYILTATVEYVNTKIAEHELTRNHPLANTALKGMMSPNDKLKLDLLDAGTILAPTIINSYTVPADTTVLEVGNAYAQDGKHLEVYLNRLRLILGMDYEETTNHSITLIGTITAHAGDLVTFIIFSSADIVAGSVGNPIATIIALGTPIIPEGYLECNGDAVSRTTYSELFSKVGVLFGVGDGSTTFNIPDLRGEFLRGYDHGRGVDIDRVFGSSQEDMFKIHIHDYIISGQSGLSGSVGNDLSTDGIPFTLQTNLAGGIETRPRNVAVVFCIKYTEIVTSQVPIGGIMYVSNDVAPDGFVKANGAEVDRGVFAALFAKIGTAFGIGDGTTTFNLPDLRAEFIRGWDDSRGVDAGRAFGSAQTDELKAHMHSMGTFHWGWLDPNPSLQYLYKTNTPVDSTGSVGGTETRPRNVALLACIKY